MRVFEGWLTGGVARSSLDHRISIPRACTPEGVPAIVVVQRRLIEITLLVFDAGFLKELDQFFSEGLLPMVFFLAPNISLDGRAQRGAHGKCGITFLPAKPGLAHGVTHPDRGCFLKFAHEIRQTMAGREPRQDMNVICGPADALGSSAQASDRASEVIVETKPPRGCNHRFPVFRGKDDVIKQTSVS